MATRKNNWQYSQAKKLLENDLISGTIPLDRSAKWDLKRSSIQNLRNFSTAIFETSFKS